MSNFITKKPVWFFIIFNLFFTIGSFAQKPQWIKSVSGAGEEIGYAMKIDPFGNTIYVGDFMGTTDFDPGSGVTSLSTPAGTRYIFIAKYDPAGALLWVKPIGGSGPSHAHGVTVDTSGNIYTTGFFNCFVADFDPGPGTFTMSATGGNNNGDVFISKLDKNGNFVWAKKIGGASNDFCFSISTDDAKNVYITGNYDGTWDFDPGVGTHTVTAVADVDAYVLKLDINGNFAWVQTIGGAFTDNAGAVKADHQGNVYATGYVAMSNFSFFAYIKKYNTNGTLLWDQQITGNPSYGGNITIDDFGNSYSLGNFDGTSDFDPDPNSVYNITGNGYRSLYALKLNNNGNFVWAKLIGTSTSVIPTSINLDKYNNICASGYFYDSLDMDPGPAVHKIFSKGSTDGFISILDSDGNYLGAASIGGHILDRAYGADIDNTGKIYVTGEFQDTLKFGASSGFPDIGSIGGYDMFLAKYSLKGVSGYVYNDINQNCIKESNEPGLNLRRGILTPGNIIIETDVNGRWNFDSLAVGNYTIVYDVQPNWLATCSNTINFSVTNSNTYMVAPNFGLRSTNPCSQPDISIIAPSIRRCFSNQKVYVEACNLVTATGALINPYVEVVLDTALIVNSATMTYTAMGNNRFRFALSSINPDQCISFNISTTVKCWTLPGRTLCMDAFLTPVDSCVLDTVTTTALPIGTGSGCTSVWDHSSLSAIGYCQNDSVYFIVTNNGSAVNGNMQCTMPVRIYVDGVMSYFHMITLAGGQSVTYGYPGNGQTWVLQADQHPQHPGNSHPTAHVEACGNIANWTPNLVNDFPLNDADPVVDSYCGIVTGSFDPNEKTGYPLGTGIQNDVLPNQQLQYVIRFQNTGSDTAMTVVIRDTLDMDLDIFSVVSGVSSHNYTFRMYGPRVLEWTFNNIMLPDSNVNEPLSHGFVTFKVDQKHNLPNGTTILNDADIYFDFNSPVITNQTLHTINDQLNNSPLVTSVNDKVNTSFKIYPNPASNNITIVNQKENIGSTYRIMNQLGQTLIAGKLNSETQTIELSSLASGFYLILIENKDTKYSLKLIKQ